MSDKTAASEGCRGQWGVMSGLPGCRAGVTECKYNNTRPNDFYWPVTAAINTVMIAASKQILSERWYWKEAR